jgi:acyl-CoA synthetase (AMP-forming)/AMP-acid ligase II
MAGRWQPPGRTLTEVLRYRERRHGDALLFGFLDPDARLTESLTYRSLLRRAAGFARLLIQNGLTGKSTLLVYPQGPEFVVAFFAASIAGAIPVPVRLPRRTEGTEALRRLASDAAAAAVLVAQRQRSIVGQRFAPEPSLAKLPLLTEPPRPERPAEVDVAVRPGDVALLQYTSGSTGRPKGVQVTQANLVAGLDVLRVALGMDQTTVTLSWAPMHHDMGLIGHILEPLYTGFPGYFLDPSAVLQQPSRWLTAISRWRVTATGGPNFGYEQCARRPPRPDGPRLDLSCWRLAYVSAEPVLAGTLDRFSAMYASAGFSPAAFYPCYGLAEATLLVTGGRPGAGARTLTVDGDQLTRGLVTPAAEPPRPESRLAAEPRQPGSHPSAAVAVRPGSHPSAAVPVRPGSHPSAAVPVRPDSHPTATTPSVRRLVGCGRPHLGTRVAIVAPRTRRELPDGRVGEIWVAGPTVAAGYRNRPEETAATFGAELAGQPGTRFLRTGDLGFISDGELFVVGRLRDRIVIRGRNLYPEDIETTAIAACSDWAATGCAVFAAADPGEGTQAVVVAVELPRRVDGELRRAITASVRERVAGVHGVAVSDVVTVTRWHLPRTTSGKVRRSECRRRYSAGTLERW